MPEEMSREDRRTRRTSRMPLQGFPYSPLAEALTEGVDAKAVGLSDTSQVSPATWERVAVERRRPHLISLNRHAAKLALGQRTPKFRTP